MALKNEEDFPNVDDFWNSSSSSRYNFDDDDKSDDIEGENLYHSVEGCNIMPIHSYISKDSLNIILDETKSNVISPIEETIKGMFHGHKYILNTYQRLDEKIKLLDSAIKISDGNIIISVIIFLKKSLKTNIFLYHLVERKVAVKHYSNYLISKNNWQELADLYLASGNISNMKNLYYIFCKETTSKPNLNKKLNQLKINHFQNISSDNKIELNENLEFLKWQIDNNFENYSSVIEQLAIVCKRDYEKNRNDEAIIEFKKLFKIDDFQYEWTIMNVLANLKLWEKLINTFIKPNWLTKKITLKSVIRSDLFLIGLSKHKPPKNILEEFLQCVSNNEMNFYLAQRLNLCKSVIKHFVNQKDRISLLRYKEQVSSQSDEYLLIEEALHIPEKKWKN